MFDSFTYNLKFALQFLFSKTLCLSGGFNKNIWACAVLKLYLLPL